MANTTQTGYDTSIGTNDRSVRSATKFWVPILLLIGLAGIILIGFFLLSPFETRSTGPVSSENTATRPAEP